MVVGDLPAGIVLLQGIELIAGPMTVMRKSWRYADANPCAARPRCLMKLALEQVFVSLPFPYPPRRAEGGSAHGHQNRLRGFMFCARRRRRLIAICCSCLEGRSTDVVGEHKT